MWRETSKKSRRENRKNVMRKQQKILFCCFLFTLQRCMINRAQYGVATISRLLKIIGLFCKRAPQKRLYSAKETYDLKEPELVATPYTTYGVATISRLLKIISFFGRISSLL